MFFFLVFFILQKDNTKKKRNVYIGFQLARVRRPKMPTSNLFFFGLSLIKFQGFLSDRFPKCEAFVIPSSPCFFLKRGGWRLFFFFLFSSS